jgi:hypothetical protein
VSGLWRSLSSAGFWLLCERLLRTTGRRPGLQTAISGERTKGGALSVGSEAFLVFRKIYLGMCASGDRRGSLEPRKRGTLLRTLWIRGLLLHLQRLL